VEISITGKGVSWKRSIRTKIGGMSAVILVIILAAFFGHRYVVGRANGQAAFLRLCEQGPRFQFESQYLAHEIIAHASAGEREELRARLRQVIAEMDSHYDTMINGSRVEGISPADDPQLLEAIKGSQDFWKTQFIPNLNRVLTSDSSRELETARIGLDRASASIGERIKKAVDRSRQINEEAGRWFDIFQYVFLAVVAVAALYVLSVGMDVARRIQKLSGTASTIARGDLSASAQMEGEDEVAVLGASLNTMTTNLRGMIDSERQRREQLDSVLAAMRETVENLSSASVEILAATAQQASSAQEAAAAVAETVTTVDEIGQTSEQAAQRAKAVSDSTKRAEETGKTGRKAVEDTIAVMRGVREQSESIAQSILALAEQAQAIGEIAAAVNDIADQVNLLALNATIEAARAGESGKGFAVVAAEVRVLADQAKKATVQVRQILDAAQKNTNSAVIATEEGNKRVGEAVRIAGEAGETIRGLAELIADASEAALQIAAGAGQQSTGMAQVTQALRNIDTAARQNLTATRQTEKAIQNLTAFGEKMKAMLERSRN